METPAYTAAGLHSHGVVRSVDWKQTTYRLEDGQAKAAYERRSSKESHTAWTTLAACTLKDLETRRVAEVSQQSSETEREQASGAGECTFDSFAGGVHISCTSRAKGTSQLNISKSGGCTNCCDSPPGEHAEKSSPTIASSSEIDLPSVDVEARFDGAGIPESLVGSKHSEGSDAAPGQTPGGRKMRFTVSWVLTRKSEYDVKVTPVGYETWRPKAGANELVRGNSLLVKAALSRKDGKPLDVPAREFVFALVRRSSEPGVMMNWPPRDQIKFDEPDLRFDEEMNAPLKLKINGDRGSEATLSPSARQRMPESSSRAKTTARRAPFTWTATACESRKADSFSSSTATRKS